MQGKNGLYVNPGPVVCPLFYLIMGVLFSTRLTRKGTQDVIWASAPHVWRINFQNGEIQK